MHTKVIGQGPNLVLLHGWSMHSAVWQMLADELANYFTLYLVDLPGHGLSDWQADGFMPESILPSLANQVPEKAYWMGWSLGGLIATQFAAAFPDRVQKLILMASSPCFVQQTAWQAAMDPNIFHAFADNLAQDQQQTLQRFLLLQARGSAHSRDTIRTLSEQISQQSPPDERALSAGLDTLINTDTREQLSNLNCPIKVILGERDTLIPVAVAPELIKLNSNIDITTIDGAGHAPFISHTRDCQLAIETFLDDV